MSAHEGGETHTHAVGMRLLLSHFETVVEREARVDHLHRKPVTFTCLRGALDFSDGPLPTPATLLLSTSGDIVDGGDGPDVEPSACDVNVANRFGVGLSKWPMATGIGTETSSRQEKFSGQSDSGVFAGFDTLATDPEAAAVAERVRASALSPVNVFRRVGLVLPEGELDTPCRRYVRRVGSEPSMMENVPNLWNQCPPPPGLLIVPDLHLPPF